MPRLLLINGLPGSGKSTLAARYVADRPLALCLDVDVVRALLGAWPEHPHDAGLLARRLALAMARVVLSEGHDVVVPQFLARPQFIAELESLAAEVEAEFVEVVLVEEPDAAAARLAHRAAGPMTAVQRDAHAMLDRAGGLATVPELHRRLHGMLASRPRARRVEPVSGDVERTYQELIDRL
ncbi:MAG TPA: AAA family ATPase [Pseudonocardia sp.]|nr:AAA family ATPase [Pseudonocardia sp.]